MLGGKPPLRREMIDHVRQMLAQSIDQFCLRHSSLLRQHLNLIFAQHLRQNVWRNLFIRPLADPGVGNLALTFLLELFEQNQFKPPLNTLTDAAGEPAARSTFEQIA